MVLLCCFFTTGTDGVRGCQSSVDVVQTSWREEAALRASLSVQAAEFREWSEGKLETEPRHAVYTKTGMRGRSWRDFCLLLVNSYLSCVCN